MDGSEMQVQDADLVAVGDAIVAGAADLAAAMARWLALVAEFDHREGWRPSGCHSCAAWLSWKCGIAPSTGREHVRVARLLEGLPLVAQAFAAGELSYSKVRALVGFVTPATEADMVDLARVATGSQMAKIARGYKQATQDPEEARRRQGLRWDWDDDGDLVVRAKIPAEVGMVFLRALSCAASELARRDNPDEDADEGATGNEGNRAAAAAADAEPDGADAPNPVDPDEARRVGLGEAFGAMAELALVGASIDKSPPPPELVITVAVEDLTSADSDSNADKDDDELNEEPTTPAVDLSVFDRPAECGRRPRRPRRAGRGRPRNRTPRPRVDSDLARRLACDATTATLLHDARGTPIDLGRRQRTVSYAQRMILRWRDGGCRFPGCGHTRFTNAHHIVHWADGGPTDLSNLITLCTFHHRLLHEGGYNVELRPDGTYRFVDNSNRTIADRPTHTGRPASLPSAAGDIRPTWGGEHLDLGHAIDALLQAEHIAAIKAANRAAAAAP